MCMDRNARDRTVIQMRETFRNLDLLGLGEFPEDEYDALADSATRVLANGGTVEDVVRRVVDRVRGDWDTSLSASRAWLLRNALAVRPE
jgi:hypothetical protein